MKILENVDEILEMWLNEIIDLAQPLAIGSMSIWDRAGQCVVPHMPGTPEMFG
jgi:hypothetical protein